jgi:predicted metal-dependent hydrolase
MVGGLIMCNENEHKWVHIDTKKHYDCAGYNNCYVRIDNFFCEKCLEIKSKRQESYAREAPDWY